MKILSRFEGILAVLKEKYSLSLEDEEWLKEIHSQGEIDTGWLQKNYNIQDGESITQEQTCPIVFGSYHALYSIAQGSACTIYKGWKQGERNFVAIKRLDPQKLSTEARERFIREYSIMNSLSHPHILKPIMSGEQQGEYFFIAPFIPDSLAQRMELLPKPHTFQSIAPLLAIFISVAQALEYSHEQGILHRDVKPENILLDGDHAYLADFGMARKFNQTLKLTKGAIGTPFYMAPEVWQKEFTPQCDIYSMGIILYELLKGEVPFTGEMPEDILVKQMTSRPKPPIGEGMQFPLALNEFVLKSLELRPKKRHASMKEFKKELVRILEECVV